MRPPHRGSCHYGMRKTRDNGITSAVLGGIVKPDPQLLRRADYAVTLSERAMLLLLGISGRLAVLPAHYPAGLRVTVTTDHQGPRRRVHYAGDGTVGGTLMILIERLQDRVEGMLLGCCCCHRHLHD